jgi:hypothetical protein
MGIVYTDSGRMDFSVFLSGAGIPPGEVLTYSRGKEEQTGGQQERAAKTQEEQDAGQVEVANEQGEPPLEQPEQQGQDPHHSAGPVPAGVQEVEEHELQHQERQRRAAQGSLGAQAQGKDIGQEVPGDDGDDDHSAAPGLVRHGRSLPGRW